MPLHIDMRINEKLLRRIHIARMTSNGMNSDSINEYAVVLGLPKNNHEGGLERKLFSEEPEQWEWDLSPIRFTHRYGDSELICLSKAIIVIQEYELANKATLTEKVE